MKDKIIELKNGINYYVLEELVYNNKKYIFGAECDLEKDTIKENDFIVMEVTLKDNELVLDDITDDNIAQIVTNMFMDKFRNSKVN